MQSRMSAMFRQWNTNTTLISAATQFHTQMNELVRETLVEAKRDKATSIESVRKECEEHSAVQVRMQNNDFNAILAEQKLTSTQEMEIIHAAREEQFKAISLIEYEKHQAQLESIKNAGLEALLAAEEVMKSEAEEMVLKHIKEMENCILLCEENMAIAMSEKEYTLHAELEHEVESVRAQHAQDVQTVIRDKDIEMSSALDAARIESDLHRVALQDEHTLCVIAAVALAEEIKDHQMISLKEQFEGSKEGLLAVAREEIMKELLFTDKEKEAQTDARISELLKAAAMEAEELHQAREVEIIQSNAEALSQQAASSDAEHARGLKLEAAKWKQAMREMEKRMALEVSQAVVEAREEKQGEMQVQLAALEAISCAAAVVVDRGHREEVEEMQRLEAERADAAHEASMAEQREALQRAENILNEEHSNVLLDEVRIAVLAAEGRLSASHALALAHHRDSAELKVRALADKMEEELVGLETQSAASLLTETSKWQLLMTAMEERLLSDVDTARITGSEEKECEMRATIDSIKEEHRIHLESVTATSDAYKKQLDDSTAQLISFEQSKKEEKTEEMRILVAEQDKLMVDTVLTHEAAIEDYMRRSKESSEEIEISHNAILESMLQSSEERCRVMDLERVASINYALSQQAASSNAEHARGLKLEAAKWKQAMREMEKRMALEVSQAVVEAREEKQGEMQVQLAALEAISCAAAVVVDRGHREEVEEMQRLEAERADAAHEASMAEQREALQRAENILRDALYEESAVTLKKEVDASWSEVSLLCDKKLKKNQDYLIHMENNFNTHMEIARVEKSEVQMRLEQTESSLAEQSALREHSAELLMTSQSEHASLLSSCKENHAKEIEVLNECFIVQQRGALEELESAYEKRLKIESVNASKPLQEELLQLHNDSVEQIGYLNSNIVQLRIDNALLNDDVTKLSKNLTDETDRLNDLREEMKKKAAEKAIRTWKMSVGIQCMQHEHDSSIGILKEKMFTEAQISDRMKMNLSTTALAALQLSSLLFTLEEIRKKMSDILLCYKVEDVSEKKTLIKELESEVRILAGEYRSSFLLSSLVFNHLLLIVYHGSTWDIRIRLVVS